MKFGCVTLSFNQGQFLSQSIESVLNQKYSADYVVYDAGSSDNSRELILKYSTNLIRHYFVEGDAGPAEGLNMSLSLIECDIFYYLNADDRLLPQSFDFIDSYFKAHPECDILHGSINLINETGEFLRTLPSMKFTLKGYALGYSIVYQQATFIRKSAIKKNAFNVGNLVSWDGELIVDLVKAGASIHQTPFILGEFRIHSSSITGSGRLVDRAKLEHARIAMKILGRNPSCFEKGYAFFIKKIKAAIRRVAPRSIKL